ncbi:MAG TPA: hypothetical protein VII38_13700 [Polyangia bacterium]
MKKAWLALTILAAACGPGGAAATDGSFPDGGPVPNDGSMALADGGGDAAVVPSGPMFGGCPLFPPQYPYNQDISKSPLDPGSATYIANLKARAGAIVAEYPGGEFLNIVPASQPEVPLMTAAEFGFDSNDAFYYHSGAALAGLTAPIPPGVMYENMNNPNSDHHMMIIEQGSCRLLELYGYNPSSATSGWSAAVTWNLGDSEQLPDGYGSTTAAGTPIVPGVIWYSEVMAGKIEHAVDIVIPGAAIAQYEYVKPAARSGGACGSPYPADGFPYGGRLRLKANYDTSSYTGTQALVVIRALQKYGMINTDASGETRSSFRLGDGNMLDKADITQLSKLTWDDFEIPTMTVVQSKACN